MSSQNSIWIIVALGAVLYIVVIGAFHIVGIARREEAVHIDVSYEAPQVSNISRDEHVPIIPNYTPIAPTLSSIFSENHDWIATLSAERVRTMIVTGDIIPARTVHYKTLTYDNFNWAWEGTADILRSADITFINLEAPLIANCPVVNEGFVFCGSERHIEGMLFAGVNVANLANNHISNFGIDGVHNTDALLRKNNIVPVGIANPQYSEVQGMTFAFLGYNDIGRQHGVAHLEDETFEQDIRVAKKNADIVVVQPHWGVEYTHTPTERQIEMAYRMIDAGADLVVGNHPHWTQPVEIYKDGVIVYAHGNFIFDQMWSQKTREGVTGRYTFYDDVLIDIEFIPILIEDFGYAKIASFDQRMQILDSLHDESVLLMR